VLLIVMDESGTWRARPGQILTFGRGAECTTRLPAADRGVSRAAGHLAFDDGAWWLRNDSSSSVLYVSGDRGFRVDLPPGCGRRGELTADDLRRLHRQAYPGQPAA